MPDAAAELRKANLSRRRAWAELMKLRRMLAPLIELAPVSKPANFEEEGKALRYGLSQIIRAYWQNMEGLAKAIDGLRPLPGGEGLMKNPAALIDLNRALQRNSDLLPTPGARKAVENP